MIHTHEAPDNARIIIFDRLLGFSVTHTFILYVFSTFSPLSSERQRFIVRMHGCICLRDALARGALSMEPREEDEKVKSFLWICNQALVAARGRVIILGWNFKEARRV